MKSFPLQIVTADGLVFDGQAESISVRAAGGDMCVQAGHCDYVTVLGMELAADTLEQAGTAITEWNERNIRDLVASVRVLSMEEILVRLKSGIEKKERLT